MQRVKWNREDLVRNLLTLPRPSLVFLDGLYINWGEGAQNLTPLPLYSNLISDHCWAQSEGNPALMYDSLRGWIPIADHLHRTNPTMPLRMSHVYDYATIWNRAERALQECNNLPCRYFHFDSRFRAAWVSGMTEAPRKRDRSQRRHIKKRRLHCIATASTPVLISDSPSAETAEKLEELSDCSSKSDCSVWPSHGLEETVVDESSDALDTPWPDRLNRDSPIMLEWSTDEDGSPILVIAKELTTLPTRMGPGRTLLTALSKGANVCEELSRSDQKCSKCLAGMCPPGIRFCTSCHLHWVHIHCTPLLVNEEGTAIFLCQGCRFPFRNFRTYPGINPGPVDARQCASCSRWVVDNSSGTFCVQCGLYFHAVCAMTAQRLAEGCFPPQFFAYRDAPRPPWHCASCSGTQSLIDFTSMETPTPLECRLPLLGHQNAPGIAVEAPFCMHLSPQHARTLLCKWQITSFVAVRHGAAFRHLLQFANMFFPEVDERALISLTQQPNCRLLSLQSTGHSGCHWLSFLLFGQTEDGGIPVILLHAVHPALQRQGIGRWGLQLLYRQCAKRVRDMTLHTQPGDLGFYTHMGFLPYQEVRYRFKAFGGTVWKRSHTLGAFLDLKLSEVVAARATMTTRAQLYRCRWLCPQHLAFMTLPGTDVCFVATMLHMLLSVPQLAAYFSMYETSPQSTGALIARCLAHLWQDSQDPDGSALVALIRARLQGDFGHAKARSKQGPKKPQTFAGQHDVGDFEQALLQSLMTEELPSDSSSLEDLPDQPYSYQELVTSSGIEVRCCDSCGSKTFREDKLAWILPLEPTQPVQTLDELLGPIFSRTFRAERPVDQPGCRRRNCVHLNYSLFTSICTLAPVIQLTVNRGQYETETVSLGTKVLVTVDVPLHLTIVLEDENCLYILRSVSFSSGGLTLSCGHYTAGKIHNSCLEHCSHTTRGASITSHTIPSLDFLRPAELRPPLPADHVITTVWYSRAVGDEHKAYTRSEETSWINRSLPPLEHADRPLSPSDYGSPPAEEPTRALRTRSSRPVKDLVSVLKAMVPPGQALSLRRGEESLAEYHLMVRESLCNAEQAEVPVLFWQTFDQQSLASLGVEMRESEALLLNTMGTTSSKGRRMSLGKALGEIRRARGGRDPFTSTDAWPGGLHQTRTGRSFMTQIASTIGLELTGGCSLLVSEPGVTTPCHFHAPGVINFCLGFATCPQGESTVRHRHPEIGAIFPCHKEYVLFVTASLETAGISLYNSDGILSLASLIARIQLLSQRQRDQIQWFHCVLDGMECNALYMPGIMLHHVVTRCQHAGFDKGLYWGIASEAIPLDLAARQSMLAKLERRVPIDGIKSAPVSSLKHIAGQSTSEHSLALLRQLVRHPEQKVQDFATWHETRSWGQLWRRYTNAHKVAAEGDHQRAEQILLTLLKDPSLDSAITRWSAVLTHSLRAVSDVLTASSDVDLQAFVLRAKASLDLGVESMEPFMTSLPLLPTATLSLAQEGSSQQSVGSHGDNT